MHKNNTIKGITKELIFKANITCPFCNEKSTELNINHKIIYGHHEEYDEPYIICPKCKKEIKIKF